MRRFLPYHPDLARLILRLALAAVLLYHGIPKLMNFTATVVAFEGMGLPAPPLTAAIALLAEVGGGLLILLGVAVDIAGILVIIDMLGAIILVHWANGFDFTKGGWEHPFTVLAMALTLALAGPGRLTVGKNYKGSERRRK
ncbi:MAG: putative oxidoreductase [Gemmatimonadales bacterium]|jgi:putative oxidoreductase|nr:putative oxidoreductase [Gemmatimonadales bacterium]